MANPDRALDVDGGLILDGMSGVFAGAGIPDYTAPDGSLHITPSGLYQRIDGAWSGGAPVGVSKPRQIALASIEEVADGELVAETTTNELVWRIGDLLYRYTPQAAASFLGQLDFSKARNSHYIGWMI